MLRRASRGRCADRLLTEDGHTSVHGTLGVTSRSSSREYKSHPWRIAPVRQLRVETRASGQLHPVWRGLSAHQASDAVQLWMTEGSPLGVCGLSPVGGCDGCPVAVASGHE
jgi:hypothetical protein